MVVALTLISLRVTKVLSGRLVDFLVRKKEDPEFQKRAQTLGSIVRYVSVFAILMIAAMMVLREFGIDIGPILAAAGIVGLAVGFGAQSLVKDVISGFFILLEDQIRVGDVVEIAGKGGLVEKINLKTTILRDLAGNVHYVPNGRIDVVTNMTKDYSRYVFDIGVAYREDVDEVIKVIKEVDEGLRNDPDFKDDILEPIEVLGLDQFANSAVVIRARTTTKPIKQWRVGREFNRRLKKIFDERNIEIPFPHVTLYMGQGKQGQFPPVQIVKEDK
ncbi:MAG: mechanosensitive ion channel family protein [Deltaproteobacteria bacterium]